MICFNTYYEGKVNKPCRMQLPDDPKTIQQVKQCEDKLECVYENYDSDNIDSTSARCMLGKHIGNVK